PAGGVPWPRLTAVSGRVTDVFHTVDGRQVYGGYFTRQFYGRDWVAQFQVVQEDYGRLRVRVVQRPGTGPALRAGRQRARAHALSAPDGRVRPRHRLVPHRRRPPGLRRVLHAAVLRTRLGGAVPGRAGGLRPPTGQGRAAPRHRPRADRGRAARAGDRLQERA